MHTFTAGIIGVALDACDGQSLARVCELTIDAQVYSTCVAYYPFVLGAQPARLIDMTAFYAAVASEGRRPAPYGIESIEQNGRPDPRVFVRARKAARARAMEVLERGAVGAEDSRTALLVAAAELFGALRTELVASPTQAALR